MNTLSGRTCVFAVALGKIGRGAVRALAEGVTERGDTIATGFDYVSEWIQNKYV